MIYDIQEVFKDEGTTEQYYAKMDALIARLGDKCAAIGECGLDYDRLEFATKEVQNKYDLFSCQSISNAFRPGSQVSASDVFT